MLERFAQDQPPPAQPGPVNISLNLDALAGLIWQWFLDHLNDIGSAIQGTAANQWYGQMEEREVREIVEHGTELSPEEQELIRKAGQGEGLLVTAGRRVWVSLYGHTSPQEFEAFNTDKEEVDNDQDGAEEIEDVLGEEDRRNGHGIAALVGSA